MFLWQDYISRYWQYAVKSVPVQLHSVATQCSSPVHRNFENSRLQPFYQLTLGFVGNAEQVIRESNF